MDSFAVPNQPPFFLFLHASVREARIPGDRNGDRAAVAEMDCQRVVSHDDIQGGGTETRNRRIIHNCFGIVPTSTRIRESVADSAKPLQTSLQDLVWRHISPRPF